MQALARNAEIAGSAMGCRFQSSAEYEAAVIAERRRTGAYKKPLLQRAFPWVVGVVAIAAVLIGLPIVR